MKVRVLHRTGVAEIAFVIARCAATGETLVEYPAGGSQWVPSTACLAVPR